MEGYTNVDGNPYDFDDLDIESPVVNEWNIQNEEKSKQIVPGPKFDEQAVLNERVKLDNGLQAKVFSVADKNGSTMYICHICTDSLVGVVNLRQHVQTQKHRTNLSKPEHPRSKFVKLDPKENLSLEPGEPVPPGLEETLIKNCAIQPVLDAYKFPLIGLEYLVELSDHPSTFVNQNYFYCLLCEKTGGERNMLIHLTSIYHYLKYLSMYFPTVARKLHNLPNKKVKKAFQLTVADIVSDIEAKLGRMKPFMEARTDFDAPGRMAELLKRVNEGPHLRESEGQYFDEKATAEYVDKKALEFLQAPPVTQKPEETNKPEENKETNVSMFNKNSRINVDKKQLRPRETDGHQSSPEVQLVDIQLPKLPPPVKRRPRSKSASSISSKSVSPSKARSRSRSRRRDSNIPRSRRWSRSRSRSPRSRHRRRSPYPRHFSPRRSRDRSPYRRRRRESPDDRHRVDRYGRSREMYDSRSDKYRRERSPDGRDSSPIGSEEKRKWDKFRIELSTIENLKLEKLKFYEKNPEKHPQYPEEWKSFWNRRYNELQRSGIDPSKHDFKPEWISFWTKRMKELHEEDLKQSKDNLRKRFDLPGDSDKDTTWKQKSRRHRSPGLVDVSPSTPDRKDVIADIKSTWKALTGSDIKEAPKRPLSPWEDDRSPPSKRDFRSPSPTLLNDKLLEDMPQRKARTSSLIFVLRKLTVLEQQLGYLAPKVFELMQQALALEKIKEEASLDLLCDPENAFYLETVREKLIGLLCAGVVPRNMVNTARSAMKHIDIALFLVSKRERVLPDRGLNLSAASASALVHQQYVEPPASDPVIVPGIGQVDKAAIAQQIASALIEQGKTNVTEGELEQLINAVVGMAEASANSAHPMTTANFLQQLQSVQNSNTPALSVNNVPTTEAVLPVFQSTQHLSTSTQSVTSHQNAESQSAVGALKLLQSAYNDPAKTEQDSPKPEVVEITSSKSSTPITDQNLAATLGMFNNTSKEEQPAFLQKLKLSNPDMFVRLCSFIPPDLISPNISKRSPISISLPKEKSEQKIKPISSGRLSPFSSRLGGANPSVGEDIIDVDEDLKVIGKSSTSGNLEINKEISSSKLNKFELDNVEDDDDDDDDYSFEDVYKAAQEKLKQQQLDETSKNNQYIQNSGDSKLNNKLNDPSSKTFNKPYELVRGDKHWNSNSQEKNMFNYQEDLQRRPNKEEEIKTSQISPRISDRVTSKEIESHITQSATYHSTTTSMQDYEDISERRPQTSQPYPVVGEYPNDSAYSKPNTEVYDKSRQYSSDDPYYSSTGPSYSNQSKNLYSDSYGEPYGNQRNPGFGNTPTNLGYGNNQMDSEYNKQTNTSYEYENRSRGYSEYKDTMSTYENDPYRYRQQQTAYGNESYGTWPHNRPGPPQRFPNSGPPQRFPNSNYPAY